MVIDYTHTSERIYPEEIINKVILTNSIKKGLQIIRNRFESRSTPTILSFINAHAYNLCCEQQSFCNALNDSDLLFRDGTGMKILFESLEKDPGINFCGTDTIPMILDEFKEKTFALLGTEEPYLQRAAAVLKKEGKKVVLTDHGFYQPEHYIKTVNQERPEVILMAMGMPKQEIVSQLLKHSLDYPCLIINGGALIDIIAGKVPRAPLWMRKMGMEWVFRLIKEPVRLFRRYIIGNIIFLKRVQQLKKQLKPAMAIKS